MWRSNLSGDQNNHIISVLNVSIRIRSSSEVVDIVALSSSSILGLRFRSSKFQFWNNFKNIFFGCWCPNMRSLEIFLNEFLGRFVMESHYRSTWLEIQGFKEFLQEMLEEFLQKVLNLIQEFLQDFLQKLLCFSALFPRASLSVSAGILVVASQKVFHNFCRKLSSFTWVSPGFFFFFDFFIQFIRKPSRCSNKIFSCNSRFPQRVLCSKSTKHFFRI